MFKIDSDLPIWLLDMITTVSAAGSEIASIIPRWYSARLVRHWPGSALASELSRRF
jgi:hypothetical protein